MEKNYVSKRYHFNEEKKLSQWILLCLYWLKCKKQTWQDEYVFAGKFNYAIEICSKNSRIIVQVLKKKI